jgi:hypothetical protein
METGFHANSLKLSEGPHCSGNPVPPWLRTEAPFVVISGGQTGVDRAALDAARDNNLLSGGWCPAGRLAEDGRIPEMYPLMETPTSEYAVRTEWNVRDSDGTLILTRENLTGGTRLTAVLALRYNKPLLVVDLSSVTDPERLAQRIIEWLRLHKIRVLNVAGPRESTCPGIYARAKWVLDALFTKMAHFGR